MSCSPRPIGALGEEREGAAGGQHHALRFVFTRRRTEGAGGFFGIERMSKGWTILAGCLSVMLAVEKGGRCDITQGSKGL
jgi:hypothetical protein